MSTILACSLYLEDDALVRAVAESNSQSNPYFVLDASIDATQVDPPPPPRTLDAAVARANDIAVKGGRPVLGLMQLAPAWLDAFGREPRDAFDPCTSVAVGSAMLSQFDYECAREAPTPKAGSRSGLAGSSAATAHRPCILRKYQEAIGLADFAAITTLELRYQRFVRPDVAGAPIFAAPAAHAWGPQELLVHAARSCLFSTGAPSHP